MVMVADFSAAHAAEKFLRPVRAGTVEAVGFLMIDPLHFKAASERAFKKIIPAPKRSWSQRTDPIEIAQTPTVNKNRPKAKSSPGPNRSHNRLSMIGLLSARSRFTDIGLTNPLTP